jgi:hypothetical protein
MVQLITNHFHRFPSPYDPPLYILSDIFRLSWREIRKILGFPPTSEIGELASMISALRTIVESTLNQQINGAAVTIPHLPGIKLEDLSEALEYAGLIDVAAYPYRYSASGYWPEAGAVYVGNGFGLCSNYRDIETCKYERSIRGNLEYVLAISYTREMLTSIWTFEGLSFARSEHEVYLFADLRLGWNYRHDYSNDFYWDKVRDAIIMPLVERRLHFNDTAQKILVSGESSGEPKFQEVLKQAVSDILPAGVPIFQVDRLYSAARGSAEFSKQTAYVYNKTGVCCQ